MRHPRSRFLAALLAWLVLAGAAALGPGAGRAAAQLPPGEILNGAFCCLEDGLGGVIRVNPLTGTQTLLAGGIKEVDGVAVGSGGVFVLRGSS